VSKSCRGGWLTTHARKENISQISQLALFKPRKNRYLRYFRVPTPDRELKDGSLCELSTLEMLSSRPLSKFTATRLSDLEILHTITELYAHDV
jgi:hypothetical protein